MRIIDGSNFEFDHPKRFPSVSLTCLGKLIEILELQFLLCMFMCALGGWTAHVCMQVLCAVCTSVQARGHHRPQDHFSGHYPPYFLKQGLPLDGDLPSKLASTFSSTGIISTHYHTQLFFMSVLGIKLR